MYAGVNTQELYKPIQELGKLETLARINANQNYQLGVVRLSF